MSEGEAAGVTVFVTAARRCDELLDDLQVLQRAKSANEAAEQRLLAELDAWLPDDLAGNERATARWQREAWLRDEVGAILRIASTTAGGRLAMASKLVQDLPATLEALEFGQLNYGHARAALDAAVHLDAEQCAAFEQRALARCDDTSVAEFRARCRRAAVAVDPKGAKKRHEHAKRDRSVGFRDDEDGMATLYAHMTAADRARVEQHLNQLTTTDSPAGH